MRIIARKTLIAFSRTRVENSLRDNTYAQLDGWYKRVLKAVWNTSAELKADFGSASIVSSNRVVFNIKGNDFRLVVEIDYKFTTVRIIWVGTHSEYDRIDAKTVTFQRSRYGIVSDSE